MLNVSLYFHFHACVVNKIFIALDMLPEYPPKSLHLKKPFKIQPWSDSEENIGNLLMVNIIFNLCFLSSSDT